MLSAEKSYFRWSNQYLIQLKRISLLCLCVCVYENKFSNSEHIRPICCYFINYSKWQKFRKIFTTSSIHSCYIHVYCVFAHLLSGQHIVRRIVLHVTVTLIKTTVMAATAAVKNTHTHKQSIQQTTTQRHTHFAMRLWYANGALYTDFILIWVPVIDENDPSFSFSINEDL